MTNAKSHPLSEGLFARTLTGSVFTAGSYALTKALQLVSSLILTRLLFPEAFRVMALVSVVLVGLAMFSDMGVGPTISQHLLSLLPVVGITLLINGFNPTRIDTANRHLLIARVTLLDLIAQLVGLAAMVGLAYALQSVWALVLGAIIGSVAKLTLMSLLLPGRTNRFGWESAAGRDLIHSASGFSCPAPAVLPCRRAIRPSWAPICRWTSWASTISLSFSPLFRCFLRAPSQARS
jgi:O-antigen/teichoic acid export membrane protein